MSARGFAAPIDLVLALIFVAATPAGAQSQQNACYSNDASISPDLKIGGCTSLIQSGSLTQDNLAIVFESRGIAYRAKGDNNRAIQDYDQAIRLNPNFANAFVNRGIVYESKQQYDRAIQDFDQAIRLNPNYANAFSSRCWGRAIWGQQLQAALADCNESLRLRPADSDTLRSRGFVYIRLSRFDDTIADCNTALRINPKNAYALFERGIAKLRKGDDAGGNADVAASRAAGPKVGTEFARYGVRP